MQKLIHNAKHDSDPSSWDPPFCGDIDIEIRRDGQWFYLGTPILRIEIIQLFARVLRRVGNDYFLVTPIEKGRIKVQDVPFVVTRCEQLNNNFLFYNNLDESITLDHDHHLYFVGTGEQAQPYLVWRANLSARLSHAVYYELCEVALQSPAQHGKHGIYSEQQFFALEP